MLKCHYEAQHVLYMAELKALKYYLPKPNIQAKWR